MVSAFGWGGSAQCLHRRAWRGGLQTAAAAAAPVQSRAWPWWSRSLPRPCLCLPGRMRVWAPAPGKAWQECAPALRPDWGMFQIRVLEQACVLLFFLIYIFCRSIVDLTVFQVHNLVIQ